MRVMLDTNVLISALLFPSQHMDLLFEKIVKIALQGTKVPFFLAVLFLLWQNEHKKNKHAARRRHHGSIHICKRKTN